MKKFSWSKEAIRGTMYIPVSLLNEGRFSVVQRTISLRGHVDSGTFHPFEKQYLRRWGIVRVFQAGHTNCLYIIRNMKGNPRSENELLFRIVHYWDIPKNEWWWSVEKFRFLGGTPQYGRMEQPAYIAIGCCETSLYTNRHPYLGEQWSPLSFDPKTTPPSFSLFNDGQIRLGDKLFSAGTPLNDFKFSKGWRASWSRACRGILRISKPGEGLDRRFVFDEYIGWEEWIPEVT